MFDPHHPAEGSIEHLLRASWRSCSVRACEFYIGLSHATPTQVVEGRRICEIVCVQNHYNLAHRSDDALIDSLGRDGIAFVPYFPLGGFTPLQSSTLTNIARRLDLTPMQLALAGPLHRAPNILAIPGTSSVAHLRENIAAAEVALSDETIAELEFQWRSLFPADASARGEHLGPASD